MTDTDTSTFKTPKELGLTQEQFCALVKTMEGLQSGRLKHDPAMKAAIDGINGFNMTVWRNSGDCGTTCCIGGWAESLGNLSLGSLERKAHERGMDGGLYSLFFGRGVRDETTPEQGAKAIQNYLTIGRPQWPKVLK